MVNQKRRIRITTIGGGGGQTQLLKSLKLIPNLEITAICTVADSGGSTGILKREFGKNKVNGYLGDVSKCILALSPKGRIKDVFNYRFPSGSLSPHSVKNIVFTSMIINNGPRDALNLMHKTLRLDPYYKVFPVSFDTTELLVKLRGGQIISGERYIDTISKNNLWDPLNHKIVDICLKDKVKMLPEVKMAIKKSDFIIFSPGDLFTSVIPNLLVKGVSKEIKKTNAKLIFITNIMTKLGETDGFNVMEFVEQIKSRIHNREPDYIVCNWGKIPKKIIDKYKIREHKVLAVLPDKTSLRKFGEKLILEDIWTKDKLGRVSHDPNKLARVLYNKILNK
jgi:uncharacterized cofD-like protein